jgi:hypothetical protein
LVVWVLAWWVVSILLRAIMAPKGLAEVARRAWARWYSLSSSPSPSTAAAAVGVGVGVGRVGVGEVVAIGIRVVVGVAKV